MNIPDSLAPHGTPLSGIDLFHICQRLVSQRNRQSIGHLLLPCGARVFYYTRLVMLRQGTEPAVEPTKALVPQEVSTTFLQVFPCVADRLEADYGCAAQLLTEPATAVPQLLQSKPVPVTPVLHQKLAEYAGVVQIASNQWTALWKSCWEQVQNQHLSALQALLAPAWLPVTPVARANDPERAALHLLRARLAQNAGERSWRVPPPGVYLYDEPLVHWLMWGLLMQSWFRELWWNGAESIRQKVSDQCREDDSFESSCVKTLCKKASAMTSADEANVFLPKKLNKPKCGEAF